MEGLNLLKGAIDAGLRVSCEGETLCIRGPKALAPMAKRLIDQKEVLLPLLRDGPLMTPRPIPAGEHTNRMASCAEIEIGYALLGKLLARGNQPSLHATGMIVLGGPVTEREQVWADAHWEAFRAVLVGEGRYTPGTLDRIYGIGEAS